MVNKGKRRAARSRGSSKRNPMYRPPQRAARPRVSFDGTNYESVTNVSSPATTAFLASFARYLDTDGGEGFLGTAGPYGFYSEYRYTKASVAWEPAVGPASSEAGARIHVAVIHNPEQMAQWRAATDVNRLAYIRGLKTYKTWNAWERVTVPLEIFQRKRFFDVNNTADHTNIDTLDRSTQSMVAFCIESVAAVASSHGSFRNCATVHLKTLNISIPS